MEKGKLLGRGVTAEVYEWGKDKVLKLYLEKYSNNEWVNHETTVSKLVHQAGVDSPEVFEEIELDGRKGVIYERIVGKTIAELMLTEPWNIYSYIHRVVVMQNNIHGFSSNGLPTQKERFTYMIKCSSYLLGNKVNRILAYVESLPEGCSICHGDIYFSNVIESGKKLVAIDWNGAYIGNPNGDVAKTCLWLCSPSLPYGIPEIAAPFSYYHKWLTYNAYISNYITLAGAKFEDIYAWLLPVAAARLKDNIPGERSWLMNIISESLRKL